MESADAGPETGPFGPIFTGLENQPEAAIERLMQEKRGEVPDAFTHPELGPIAFVYGDEKMGLRHIAQKRGMEWVNRVPEILRNGRVERDPKLPRVFIVQESDPANVAVIRLDWFGDQKTWLITAYPDSKGEWSGADKTIGTADDAQGSVQGNPSRSNPLEGNPTTPSKATPEAKPESTEITDFGEKIGRARKDMAVKGEPKPKKAKESKDERPAWARRYNIGQAVKSSNPAHEGRWFITDTRSKDSWTGKPKTVGERGGYATRAEAEADLAVIDFSRNHMFRTTADGKYSIWRRINDRKMVRVVSESFDSRVAALEYAAENARDIIETNTTFGEADIPKPPSTVRIGEARREGDIKDSAFTEVFGFRGVEFGNWNNQAERQELLNDAYDGLLDLAEVLGIPPKALSLNGEMALAFGARGHGLSSARAHYEPNKVVINLTKENGAGSLAHEWLHALDHYFGRIDGKAPSQWVVDADGTRSLKVSEDYFVSSGASWNGSKMRQEMREAFANLMDTIASKAVEYVEDTENADKFVGKAREGVAEELQSIREWLARQLTYGKRNTKPATEEQLAEFDTIAERILAGGALETTTREVGRSYRVTNDDLEALSAILKAVRGTAGFTSERKGRLDTLRYRMDDYRRRLKLLKGAEQEATKTRKTPTSFKMDAMSLDQGRGSNYWTLPHELAARAFQGYVEDKIAERGGQSPFLNFGPERAALLTPWGVAHPFPRGAERKAINAAFDKLMTTMQYREDPETGNVALFSFAGQNAATADTHALETAQARIERGDDAETVRKETGWHKGKDGKWRFEISDKDARLIGLRDDGRRKSHQDDYLGDVIDHPSLFAAYPALRKVRVEITVDPAFKEESGSFDLPRPEDAGTVADAPRIKVMARNEREALSTLLHEIQHGIQDIEGFATGGSPAQFASGPMFDARARDLQADLSENLTGGVSARPEEIAGAVKYGDQSELAAIARRHGFESLDAALEFLRQEDEKRTPFGQYRRLAGEVEARNTQARQGMTEAERRATPPSTTQDVSDSDVIVTWNGTEMASAPAPANARPSKSGNTVTALRAALKRAYGGVLAGLESAGLVTLVQTQDEAIAAAATARAQVTGESVHGALQSLRASHAQGGTIQGFYEPASGQSFLIADGIAAGNESGVLAHEIGIHWANDTSDPKGQKAMQRVLDGAQKLVENNRSPFMGRVRARMKDAGETSAEEAAAYIAETYENDRAKAPGSVRQWIKDTLAAIRAWLLTKGVKLARLTPADITAIARANVRRAAAEGVAPGRGGAVRRSVASDAEVRALVEQYASEDGAPSEDAIRAAVKDYRDTERAYGGQDAYDRARAAGRTKLNYRQWVQVRTAHFKRWFGDWEASRAQERLDAMEPVALNLPDNLRGASLTQLREAVKMYLDALAESNTTAKHEMLGEVGFSKGNNKKAVSTGATAEKLHAARDIVNVIESAIHFDSALSAKPDEARHGVTYHALAAKVSAFGREFVAVVTVKQSPDGQRFYNNIAVQSGQEKAPAAYPGERASKDVGSTTAFTGADASLLPAMRRVNPAEVSKVVDPETGEPAVLYHGTNANFDAFRPDANGLIFASPSAFQAGEFAEGAASRSAERAGVSALDYMILNKGLAPGANIMPVFVSAKNPFDASNMEYKNVETPAFVSSVKADGHDSVWVKEHHTNSHKNIAVFHPNQIKSATANIGTFGESDNIRFSLPDRPGQSFLTSASDVQAAVRQVMSGWKGDKPIVRVVQKPSDIKSSLWDVNAPGAKTAEGWFDGRGTVYLIAGNNRNIGRALEVLAHEAYGHYGIERVVGADEWAKIVSQVKTLRDKSKADMSAKVWDALQSAERRYGKHDDTSFAKEFLAILAERGVKTGPLGKVLDALRAFIKKVTGYDIAAAKFDRVWKFKAGWDGEAVFTARELLGIVERGRQQVRAGRAGASLTAPAMASAATSARRP